MNFKLKPTRQVALFLAIYACFSSYFNLSKQLFLHFLATIVFAIILFYFFKLITKKEKKIENTIISGIILFLVAHYGFKNIDLIYTLLATFLTISSKFFLNTKKGQIINPAVFGLLSAYLIIKILPGENIFFISWWGTNTSAELFGINFQGYIPLFLMAFWIFFGLKNWRKYPTLISFLVTHFLLIIITKQSIETVKFIFLDATIYFYTAIMLIEPKSSPILKKQQIEFGILAGIIYNSINYFEIAQADLIGIAIANIYFYLRKVYIKPQSKKTS